MVRCEVVTSFLLKGRIIFGTCVNCWIALCLSVIFNDKGDVIC